jgi:hypothetical protein
MTDHLTSRLISELEKLMEQMQYLVDHPRMQQRNWVAQGKVWLPILGHVKTHLLAEKKDSDYVSEAHQALLDSLQRVGLEVKQRDRTTWGYSWNGTILIGAYSSQAQAVEAALRAKLPQSK